MAGINFAGEFKIEECVIHTASGNKTDIGKLVVQIDLFESLFEKSLSGSVFIQDTNALDLNMPVTGHDFLTLKIKTPGLDGRGEFIDFTQCPLIVYRMGTKQELGETANLTELSVMTKDFMRSERHRTNLAYDGVISDIAEKVLREEVKTVRPLFIEPTVGNRNMVVPNMRPFDVCRLLAGEAVSEQEGSPHYLFYENTKGIHFRSLQSLYTQDIKQEFFASSPGVQNKENSEKTPNIEKELKRVSTFEQGAISDTVGNYRNGVLCSKQIQHDIFGKRYNVKTFNYIDDFKSHKRINFNDKDKDNPIYADTNIDGDNKISDFTDAKIYVTPISAAPKDINIDASYMKDGAKYGEGFLYSNNRSHDSLLSRRSKLVELNTGPSVNIQVNGQTHLSCGDIVRFDMPIQGRNHEGEDTNKYYKGRFLISTLRHTFSNLSTKHEILMRLVRDSFETPIPVVAEVDDFSTGVRSETDKDLYVL